jgi:hypothetical protein
MGATESKSHTEYAAAAHQFLGNSINARRMPVNAARLGTAVHPGFSGFLFAAGRESIIL